MMFDDAHLLVRELFRCASPKLNWRTLGLLPVDGIELIDIFENWLKVVDFQKVKYCLNHCLKAARNRL